ncbi:cyclic nucleotide-binding domain-containing protein [Candidatus Chloroploca sp. M-50]|uniref:Cyclic nucleotide-binding domain-containing protein n=1 Tax=Candidatus Chloroploca mongolica TaxID=2528176 RepID=A0ABS4DCL1_9CHLR|nr:cyclic nucleotide-binding domain-containing protein [Candidatus Chloroploca mongolica]MBP1467172.1 cyclic nucleotide-binding domain-containing protein [Candidatus Chloroploca mongolica]
MDALSQRIRLLEAVRFFDGAYEDALPTIAAALESVRLGEGQLLFQKGDVGDSLYVIISGGVRIHDDALIFNELGPGEVVGEMAVLDAEPRSASVTATQATELLCLRQAVLYDLIENHSGVARGIIHVLTRHLRSRVRDVIEDYAYISQVRIITEAAQAINDGRYTPASLADVGRRDDALGQLARTFQQMADEVIAREQNLRREVQELRIEIDRTRQQNQVAEITENDYFRRLQQQARAMRASVGENKTGDKSTPES